MRNEIKPNDIVLHKPSGEKWVVAGVNREAGCLIPKGYPFPSVARLEDCEIIERRYEFERQDENLIKFFRDNGMNGYIDGLSYMFTDFV